MRSRIGVVVLAILSVAFGVGAFAQGDSEAHPVHVETPDAVVATFEPTVLPVQFEEARRWETHVYLQGIQAYDDALVRYQADLDREEAERVAAVARAAAVTVRPSTSSPAAVSTSSGSCASGGGNYQANPNGGYVARESGGDYCARNPSGACGAYQIMPGTWQGFGGYASACDAPPAVQDQKAQSMAACNWHPPNYCAG